MRWILICVLKNSTKNKMSCSKISGDKIDLEKLKTFMASNYDQPRWVENKPIVTEYCYKIISSIIFSQNSQAKNKLVTIVFLEQTINSITYNKKVCDPKGFLIAQCVQDRLNMVYSFA